MKTKRILLPCILSLLLVLSLAAAASAAASVSAQQYGSSALLGSVNDYWGNTYRITLLYTPSDSGPSTDYEYKVVLGHYTKLIQGTTEFNAFFPKLLEARQQYATNKAASKASAAEAYTYITGIVPTQNTDATLSNLRVNGRTVSGFAPSTTTYNVALPAGTTTIPTVSATVNDTGHANAVVTQATSLTGSASIVVTAQDGTTTKTYTIHFTVVVPVTSITVSGAGNATTVKKGSNLQMSATVLPANATNSSITWSVTNGTGRASINSSGLLTGTSVGTVTVKATAKDGSGKTGTDVITIQAATIPVTSITVTGSGNASSLKVGSTLQISATVLPVNATNNSVTWSVSNGTGKATIDANGLLTGTSVGTVTVKAMAKDGSGKTGTKVITIEAIKVTSITISGAGNATSVKKGSNLQMSATVLPVIATNNSVTWSVANGTGKATINSNGQLKGTKVGTVTVTATAKDGSGISGTEVITVTP